MHQVSDIKPEDLLSFFAKLRQGFAHARNGSPDFGHWARKPCTKPSDGICAGLLAAKPADATRIRSRCLHSVASSRIFSSSALIELSAIFEASSPRSGSLL